MTNRLLDQVRTSCQRVAEQAVHVRIDYDRLPAYAASLPLDRLEQPEIDPERHYLGAEPETVAFFVTLDAINFGSGYFPHLRKRPGMSGYFTLATRLTERFRRHGPWTADELAVLTPEQCTAVFGQDPQDTTIAELMGLFAQAWNDLGRYLLSHFEGSFVRLIEAAGGSAEALVGLLRAMPLFNDACAYGSREVLFLKRAQLTAADLALALHGQGLGRLHDLDQLTIFADNLVPHVLRVDGVLRYPAELIARIDREELIPPGSPEEIEIRASAVHAVELIGAQLRQAGRQVNPMSLDYVLWNRGQAPAYKAVRRHRTRTVFY
jgi:hypothetical protein